ncbi:MAG: heme acquisition protein HasA [Halomonas sp.]|uniref:Heme acquisition protein HasAp n=2 Tax=Oceanospirillales TaxID=135619 RepID=A0A2A4HG57_9GAMM|nr:MULTISPECIES: heme acquisition protein HasA [Halomonas]PCF93620.1 heme acquisition protein HasAp [Halomonas nigrificans]HCR97152.1 heme acquisition protein HasAp [Halomonas sp.]
MSISYTYDENNFPELFIPGSSLESLLLEFEESGAPGEHSDDNPGGINEGGFFTNGVGSGLAGDTYAMANNEGAFAFSATGDLSYNFADHALTGTLESLTLGSHLLNGEVVNDFITFTFDDPIVASHNGRGNEVHDIIWGLMNGSVEGADDSAGTGTNGGLLAVLDDAGLLGDAIPASVTGVSTSEFDFALAA